MPISTTTTLSLTAPTEVPRANHAPRLWLNTACHEELQRACTGQRILNFYVQILSTIVTGIYVSIALVVVYAVLRWLYCEDAQDPVTWFLENVEEDGRRERQRLVERRRDEENE